MKRMSPVNPFTTFNRVCRTGLRSVVLSALLLPVLLSAQKPQWMAQAGGSAFEEGRSLAVDPQGNVYVAGTFAGTTHLGAVQLSSKGIFDVFFAKYDPSGQLLWARQVGGTGVDAGYGLALDGQGNIYLTGNFTGQSDFDPGPGTFNLASTGSFDIFLAKYDPDGQLLWARTMGGLLYQEATGIGVDAAGQVTLAGSFMGQSDFDPGPGAALLEAAAGVSDLYLAQYDAAGNLRWVRQLRGNGSNRVLDLASGPGGNICITGQFENTTDFDPSGGEWELTAAGSFDVFVARFDPTGQLDWARAIGGNSFDDGQGIAVDSTGSVYLTGRFHNTVDFDPGAGERLLTAVEFSDVFLARYDAAGQLDWAHRVGSDLPDAGSAVAADPAGGVWLSGQFLGTADFDPSDEVAELTPAGDFDIFLARYDAGGHLTSAARIGGTNMEESFALATDAGQHVYLAGLFKGTADFHPGVDVEAMTSGGEEDMFVVKYRGESTAAPALPSVPARVYPVPARDLLYVEWPGPAEDGRITIFDQAGRVAYSRNEKTTAVDLSGWENGSYYLLLDTGTGRQVSVFQVLK